jgi:hypothetical protein
MYMPKQTPEQIAAYEEKRFCEELNQARSFNFCHCCGALKELSKKQPYSKKDQLNRYDCNTKDCIIAQNRREGKAVNNMTNETLLEIIQNKLPNINMIQEGDDKWNVSFRDGRNSIGFHCSRWGLTNAVEAILQVAVFGTDTEYVEGFNGAYLTITPRVQSDWQIVKWCMAGHGDSIYFEAETVFDANWYK